MIDGNRQPLAMARLQAQGRSVLIGLGDHDDSLYYQAPLGTRLTNTCYVIEFHGTSLILERLRLHGALDVTARFVEGGFFTGKISLIAAESGSAEVRLEIVDEIVSDECVQVYSPYLT